MEILKMITAHDGAETDMVLGPEIPLTFTVDEGVITMDTRRPLDFYTNNEDFESDSRHELDVTVKDFMYKHNEPDYGKAMRMVLAADPELKARYAKS